MTPTRDSVLLILGGATAKGWRTTAGLCRSWLAQDRSLRRQGRHMLACFALGVLAGLALAYALTH